jgi:hypothetical protein
VTAPSKGKPTAREVWEGIDETAYEEEVKRVLAMSDAEVEAELLKDGFDPAKLAAPVQKHGDGAPEPPATERRPAPVTRLPLRRRTAPWFATAAATVTALLGGYAAMTPSFVTNPPPDAAALRKEAREACAKAQWRVCLDRLHLADDLDPAGAKDPSVRELRDQAERGAQAGGAGSPR